jgi:hypothetical protein
VQRLDGLGARAERARARRVRRGIAAGGVEQRLLAGSAGRGASLIGRSQVEDAPLVAGGAPGVHTLARRLHARLLIALLGVVAVGERPLEPGVHRARVRPACPAAACPSASSGARCLPSPCPPPWFGSRGEAFDPAPSGRPTRVPPSSPKPSRWSPSRSPSFT